MIKILYVPSGKILEYPETEFYQGNYLTCDYTQSHFFKKYRYSVNEFIFNLTFGSFIHLLRVNDIMEIPVSIEEFEVLYD